MTDRKLLSKAIEWEEWNTVFYLMDQLCGEYLEGYIQTAAKPFNDILRAMPINIINKYASVSIWTKHWHKECANAM